jgi:hypothetical protein
MARMATYFVENLTSPVAHGTDYPGTRIDAANEASAASTFRASTNAQPGDRLRVSLDGANYIFFFDVAPGAPVTAPGARPVLPPVGG